MNCFLIQNSLVISKLMFRFMAAPLNGPMATFGGQWSSWTNQPTIQPVKLSWDKKVPPEMSYIQHKEEFFFNLVFFYSNISLKIRCVFKKNKEIFIFFITEVRPNFTPYPCVFLFVCRFVPFEALSLAVFRFLYKIV